MREGTAITVADSPEDIAAARVLFREYATWLGFSLSFQGFDHELANLPGKYASPSGRLLLAHCDSMIAGCGALRPVELGICEMKRLYVRPGFRGRRLGFELAERLISDAKAIGYSFMRLDPGPKTVGGCNSTLPLSRLLRDPALLQQPTTGRLLFGVAAAINNEKGRLILALTLATQRSHA
jgi:putative acetyltransferase